MRVGDTVCINNFEGDSYAYWWTGSDNSYLGSYGSVGTLMLKSLVNHSRTGRLKINIVRTVIAIKINRHDKPQDVQAVIYQVLASHKDVLSEPASEVFLKELVGWYDRI